MSPRLPYSRFAVAALALLLGAVVPVLAQNYDPDNEDMKPLMTLAGGLEYFINLQSLRLEDEVEGKLAFDVVWYTVEQRNEGGFSRARNELNCLKGTYFRSPAFQTFNASGGLLTSNAPVIPSYVSPYNVTLRNDGLSLYRNLKDTCVKYSELDEADLDRW